MASVLKFDEWQNSAGVKHGTVLQVVSTTVTAVASTTNTDARTVGGDVGLNVTITPRSSSSKFFITCDIGIGTCGGNTWAAILSRDNVKVGNGNATTNNAGVWFRGVDHAGNSGTDVNHGIGASGSYMDNTSGTAGVAITYRCGLAGETSPTTINRVESDYTIADGGTTPVSGRTSSTITVMEIAV
jgi:hypothetical protein